MAFGAGLIGLALVAAVKPPRAERFLRCFASSATAHFTEQASRLILGAALVIFAPSMWHQDLFEILGWLMIVTAVGLMLIPWRWHHKFGQWAIPLAIRHLKLFAVGAVALGLFILYGATRAVFP